jgi:GNAT superfamily N-acetyltransferase
MTSALTVETLAGHAVLPVIADLARLRVEVFREWPYLYDGDLAYEHKYLAKYADLPDATIVVARADGRVIGASTALPLLKAEAAMGRPFLAAGLDPGRWYYFGESVLERAFRGRGLGVRFFAAREQRATELGYRNTTFCAVMRPDDHPRRPHGYVALDRFWTRRGYVKRPELVTSFEWMDLDEAAETAKPMVFWTKEG